jgi:YfiH family protein
MREFWIEPDWPAPPGIRAVSTLRRGGVSEGPYASLNLGAHVGDNPERVAENRRRLAETLCLPSEPVWLNQVHGHQVIRAEAADDRTADASFTREPGIVCGIMTADCLPVLLCSRDGAAVAAVHAGWKGLAGGVVESAVAAMGTRDLLAWLGPAIGPEAFEVGSEVREAFLHSGAEFAAGFHETANGKWLADICRLARIILHRLDIAEIHGGGWCTFGNAEDFFSYRRDRVTGRMATLIWRE